ncbi:MAG: tRNA 4-thiouridine(8) synthase ThiI [Euryarchaeota archaeon]|nr:tRNA 4-thiouridine(8) synthase ThiI [Euryarchaeota archaeon]
MKSDRVRSRYERILVENIRKTLVFCEISYDSITRDFGRIFVKTRDTRAALAIARVFGVVSTSCVETCAADLDVIASAALELVTPFLTHGESFGIRARRTGTHRFSSKDIGVVVGRKIVERLAAPVRLSRPDVQVYIDVRADRAYLYTEIIQGVGGLPLGTQGKIVALISGGIDSPVAAWLMMKRGCTVIPVFLDCGSYTGAQGKQRVLECLKALAVWGQAPLNVANLRHDMSLAKFKELCPRLTCVLCKRMMYRIATVIAKQEGAHGIITGESIGQVASQTTQNLLAIDDAGGVPIYRPLIGMDKTEIIRLARYIGTYRLSTYGDSMSCSAAHHHPTTNADINEVAQCEAQLSICDLSNKETESLTWDAILPDKGYRWVLSANKHEHQA